VSSIKPNHCCTPLDGSEEVASGLIVASGDTTELFELGKQVFDKVPNFVRGFIVFARFFAINAALDFFVRFA
jgi:hypothetical protein